MTDGMDGAAVRAEIEIQSFHFEVRRLAARSGPRGARRTRTLRLAQAFLIKNATRRYSSRELCAAVSLSERAVEKLFEEACGMSPRAWHTNYRLDRVRADLLASRFAIVTQVASDWGFLELGRFSRQYRERFGERPSATLRSALSGFAAQRPPNTDEQLAAAGRC